MKNNNFNNDTKLKSEPALAILLHFPLILLLDDC